MSTVTETKYAHIEDLTRARDPHRWYGEGKTYTLALWSAILAYRENEAKYSKSA